MRQLVRFFGDDSWELGSKQIMIAFSRYTPEFVTSKNDVAKFCDSLLQTLLSKASAACITAFTMQEQFAVQNLLRTKLAEIQRSNPGYSLRAYARKVGVHPGALTYIVNGKRNVSRKLAERITRRLLLDPQQRSEILGLFPEKTKYRKDSALTPPEPKYLELSAAEFKIAAEWEHFAVMSLANCEDFEASEEWIAGRLGITSERAKQVVGRLLQLGLFRSDKSGRISRSKKGYRTTDDVAEISLKKHHEQTLELAKESLWQHDVDIRDFTTITMAIDPRKISTAKERIRKFQDELTDLLETGHKTEVYRLSVQLFPLSKVAGKAGEKL